MFDDYMDMVSTEDVREMLDIGTNTLYVLLNSGELKGFKCGRRWKIPKTAIEEYIQRKSGLATPQLQSPHVRSKLG